MNTHRATRRAFLAIGGLTFLTGCNATPATVQTDIKLVSDGLNAKLPVFLAISGLSAVQRAVITDDVGKATAAAQALTSSFISTSNTWPQTFVSAVEDLVVFLNTPAITAVIPPNAAEIIAAVSSLLPIVTAALGLTSAPKVPTSKMPAAKARIILATAHG